jgi:hypothetical protein
VLEFLREGDVLMVTRIDRLARSIGDLQDIVRAVRTRGASLKATEQPIDTGTAAGKCFLDMLGVFAEFETNLRRERQLEGIAKAKAAGVYKGRPASIDAAQVRAMKAQGLGADRAGWRSPSILTVSELARNTVTNSPLNTQEVSNGPDLSDPSTPPRGRDHLHPNHGVDADVPPNWREPARASAWRARACRSVQPATCHYFQLISEFYHA